MPFAELCNWHIFCRYLVVAPLPPSPGTPGILGSDSDGVMEDILGMLLATAAPACDGSIFPMEMLMAPLAMFTGSSEEWEPSPECCKRVTY